ncbi:unnamed protein product [Prunus armeniaca]
MCDDTKQYTYSSHTPALPTPCMGPAISWSSHHTGTANAMCGKPSNQGMDKKQLQQPCPCAATRAGSAWVCREISGDGKISTPTLTLPTLASSQGQDHFIQLPRGPIRTGTGRNFQLKTGQNLGFQFGSKPQNRSKPKQQSARIRKKEKKTHQLYLKQTAEAAAQRSETSGLNQSIPSTILRLSGKEIGWVLIGTSRRVQRDWSRGLR